MTHVPASPRFSILQFVLPSVRDIVFICLFWSLLAGPLSNRPLADVDIGWHIRNGEQMLATHTIPRTDSFSSTMHGQPWFAWEWLYDVVLGILHRAAGLNGVVWLAALLISLTLTLLLWRLLNIGTGLPLAIVLMLLAEGAASIHMFARPHIVSWLFTLLWFIALERWEEGSAPQWLPWFFPSSMVLWVNLHAGWVFGFALLAIYMLSAFGQSLRVADATARIRAVHRARRMLLALGLSVLTTLVNPYGWRLHTHIYQYLSDRYLMDRIVEFRSPDFHGWAQRCFAIILLAALVALAGNRSRLRISQIAVVLLATYAGLYAVRNLPISAFLLVLVTGPILWQNLVSLGERVGAWRPARGSAERIRRFSDRVSEQELQLRGHGWAVVAVVVALLACLHGGSLAKWELVRAQFDSKHLPVAAAEDLEHEPSRAPVFTQDQWSGYVIYRLYPRRQVVIDDRHDLYGSDRFREYLILIQAEQGWKNVLEKWKMRTIVLPTDATLTNLLRDLPQEWHVAYEDKVAVVFEKQ